jgi:hypothetical protein
VTPYGHAELGDNGTPRLPPPIISINSAHPNPNLSRERNRRIGFLSFILPPIIIILTYFRREQRMHVNCSRFWGRRKMKQKIDIHEVLLM